MQIGVSIVALKHFLVSVVKNSRFFLTRPNKYHTDIGFYYFFLKLLAGNCRIFLVSSCLHVNITFELSN